MGPQFGAILATPILSKLDMILAFWTYRQNICPLTGLNHQNSPNKTLQSTFDICKILYPIYKPVDIIRETYEPGRYKDLNKSRPSCVITKIGEFEIANHL